MQTQYALMQQQAIKRTVVVVNVVEVD